MATKPTLVRNLEILMRLSKPGGVDIKQLAEENEVSIRTIQRLIEQYREAGFFIESIGGRYKIDAIQTKKDNKFDVRDLLYFSKDEAWLLHTAVNNISGNQKIKENLVKKLYSIYGSEQIIGNMINQHDSVQFQTLLDAIQHKLQVTVTEYTHTSSNGGLRGVLIEPIQFADDYSRVWAYYPQRKINFLMRMSGIHGIKPTFRQQQFTHLHKVGFVDIFKGYGFKKTPIRLRVDHRAKGYLLEEFPHSRPFIEREDDGKFSFQTEVAEFGPVARFCLGLPFNVEIIEPQELKDFIKLPHYSNDERKKKFAEVTGAWEDI